MAFENDDCVELEVAESGAFRFDDEFSFSRETESIIGSVITEKILILETWIATDELGMSEIFTGSIVPATARIIR